MDIETMALELMEYRTLDDKEEYLLENGRVAHIPSKSKLAKFFSKEETDRFIRIGEFFYARNEKDSDQRYRDICKMNGEYVFEYYPVLFEFYDEYLNGYTYNEEDILEIKKKASK